MIRRVGSNDVVYYASELLEAVGVIHAFSTRIGGVSPPPFESLNLGNPSGCEIQDDYERIWENYRRLQKASGAGDRPVLRIHQVHGAIVTRAESTKPFDTHQKGDAIVSDDPERSVSVRIADCVPILLASDDGRIVAAVHAGWRGVIAGVVPAAIDVMRQTRAGAAGLIAAVGPCISEDAFEVGPDVLAEFTRVFGAAAPARSTADGKGRVDLRAAVMIQLIAAGIPADQIDVTDRCTVRDRDEFYSHRRDNGLTGRMAAVIAANG